MHRDIQKKKVGLNYSTLLQIHIIINLFYFITS